PCVALLRPARACEKAGYGRQDCRRVLPADMLEELEGLVDEVEAVAAVGVDAVGRRQQHDLGKFCGRGSSVNRGEQRALCRVGMAHGGPVPEPAPDRLRWQRLVERLACMASRLPLAVLRHVANALVESQIRRVIRKLREETRECGKHTE